MGGLVTKVVDCVQNGTVMVSYPLSYAVIIGQAAPPNLIEEAKETLINQGLIKPPFDFTGITFEIRDGR